MNKRLGFELGGLRHNLCRERGKALNHRRLLEDKPEILSDIYRWVHTSVMAADCLVMKEDHRLSVLETDEWYCREGDEAKTVKLGTHWQGRGGPQSEHEQYDPNHSQTCLSMCNGDRTAGNMIAREPLDARKLVRP